MTITLEPLIETWLTERAQAEGRPKSDLANEILFTELQPKQDYDVENDPKFEAFLRGPILQDIREMDAGIGKSYTIDAAEEYLAQARAARK